MLVAIAVADVEVAVVVVGVEVAEDTELLEEVPEAVVPVEGVHCE